MMLSGVLALNNNMWEEGVVSEARRQAVVVPILKPRKEAKNPGSYRSLDLTVVMCKTVERMVTDRLVYVLKKEGRFSNIRKRFRLRRGTMEYALLLQSEVQKAKIHKDFVVARILGFREGI